MASPASRNLSLERRQLFLEGPIARGLIVLAIPIIGVNAGKKLKIGLITDLHHLQLGKVEEARMKGFMDAVMMEKPDFIIQNDVLCRPNKSEDIIT